jgi:hypothetical protein
MMAWNPERRRARWSAHGSLQGLAACLGRKPTVGNHVRNWSPRRRLCGPGSRRCSIMQVKMCVCTGGGLSACGGGRVLDVRADRSRCGRGFRHSSWASWSKLRSAFPLTPLRLFEALQGCMVLCCALKEVAMSRMQWKKIAQEFMFPLFHSHTLSTNIPVYEC